MVRTIVKKWTKWRPFQAPTALWNHCQTQLSFYYWGSSVRTHFRSTVKLFNVGKFPKRSGPVQPDSCPTNFHTFHRFVMKWLAQFVLQRHHPVRHHWARRELWNLDAVAAAAGVGLVVLPQQRLGGVESLGWMKKKEMRPRPESLEQRWPSWDWQPKELE